MTASAVGAGESRAETESEVERRDERSGSRSEPASGRPLGDHLRASERTGRWKGIGVVALLTSGVGVVSREPGLVLAAAVGVGYLAYVRAAAVRGTRSPPALSVERSYETDPDPGERVRVETTVTNGSDRLLADVRLVDGVPEPLPVVDGAPRVATTLAPGESTTLSYAVEAKRGEHAFEPLLALLRDPAGETERTVRVTTADAVVSTPSTASVAELPLRPQTTRYAGRVETDDGGEGVEFHATREYRSGDPTSRIDWNRYARTNELATVEFRQERAATVVLVLDLRPAAYRRADDTGLHAADRGVEAASRVFASLLETGDRVGVGALAAEEVWLPPGAGNDHRARARKLFVSHPALSSTMPTERVPVRVAVRRLRKRLPEAAQVVLCSPLCDDGALRAARRLEAHGHAVTVVSPDPTADRTPGQRLADAERTARANDLRAGGVRVVDWKPDDRLSTAIDRAGRRWSG